MGDTRSYSYYVSNASLSTRLKTFVWLSGLRWAIEQCFEETKSVDHHAVGEILRTPAIRELMLTEIVIGIKQIIPSFPFTT
ncbi:MAG: hypothetical protein QMD03_06410 [Syntrophales bacterium]|nr:hypothetical protein [Syntrophales bacterium]